MVTKEMRAALKKAFGTGDPRRILGRPFSYSCLRFDDKRLFNLGIVAGISTIDTVDGKIGMVICRPFQSYPSEKFEGFSINLCEKKPVWRDSGTEGVLRLL
jgi:hypothetical protein